MARRQPTSIERAQLAKRESGKLDFKERFDPGVRAEWPELLKDFVAMANSGGGLIVIGVCNNGSVSEADVSPVLSLDPAKITDKVEKYTGVHFAEFDIQPIERDGQSVALIEIGAAQDAPIVFTQVGTYMPVGETQQKTAFSKGTVYVRHGAKSEPATTADLRRFLDRRIAQLREQWLDRVRQVIEAPEGALVAMVETTESEIDGTPTTIRLTDDPAAPTYGKLSPDQTHPYRQKELLEEINARLPAGVTVNTHDMLSVRRVHDIREATHPQFAHEPRFASRQYSKAFAEWLLDQFKRDATFFRRAKDEYSRRTSAASSDPGSNSA
jgi:hypothetical protein